MGTLFELHRVDKYTNTANREDNFASERFTMDWIRASVQYVGETCRTGNEIDIEGL